jgi:SAM-dependent methyltransferase
MTAPTDWWRTFFKGLAVESWLHATTDEQTRAEADFIQQTLQVPPPARLLDVPCGGGRHSLALAARGYRMTGVDLSTDFLAAARAGAAERSLPVQWEQRDMRDLPWKEEFDGAFSFGNSFGYLDDDGNAAFLKAVAAALRPGARFVLDTAYITESLLPKLQQRTWYQVGDLLALGDRRYDPLTGRLHVEYTWVRDGRIEKQAMSARLHSYREVRMLLEAAGFTDVQGFGSLAREPFSLASHGLIMSAVKVSRPSAGGGLRATSA